MYRYVWRKGKGLWGCLVDGEGRSVVNPLDRRSDVTRGLYLRTSLSVHTDIGRHIDMTVTLRIEGSVLRNSL